MTSENFKIFVRNVTVLDCAILMPSARGQSWIVDIEWHGALDPEGVVMDFGIAKKSAKKTIDDLFDHRLWVDAANVLKSQGDRIVISGLIANATTSGPLWLDCPSQTVRVFEQPLHRDGCLVMDTIVSEIRAELLSHTATNVVDIKVTLRAETEDATVFSYTHSLRQHAGNCQRFHGHRNKIEVWVAGKIDALKSAEFAASLDGLFLIGGQSLVAQSSSPCIGQYHNAQMQAIEYEGSQGHVAMIMPKSLVLPLPSESTIENMSQFFYEKLAGVDRVIAYEGIGKGSIFP